MEVCFRRTEHMAAQQDSGHGNVGSAQRHVPSAFVGNPARNLWKLHLPKSAFGHAFSVVLVRSLHRNLFAGKLRRTTFDGISRATYLALVVNPRLARTPNISSVISMTEGRFPSEI